MELAVGQRPRTVGPARAAALLYGDWGTSKAYVLGIAFGLAGYSSFPILVAMAVLTALVGLNYYFVCTYYPDGGGVYSAVRDRSRLIASIGALLLLADYLVTASLSVLEGFNYLAHLLEAQFGLHMPAPNLWAIVFLLLLGVINWWGTRHSGSLAVVLAIPASLAAISVAVLALPYLGQARFEESTRSFVQNWGLFAGIVLALSGVEAVSNMTGVMVPDRKPGPTGAVGVSRTSAWTVGIVAAEVVTLTVILAWAMHAVPTLDQGNIEAMLGQMASYYGTLSFGERAGQIYASVVGVVVALLLFSAGNTAINGMIAVFYMMSKDSEMPKVFGRLNKHGVPTLPLVVSCVAPALLLMIFTETEALAHLYAIGVVGAITINLGACSINPRLPMKLWIRIVMGGTALLMTAIWITIGVEKHEALIFAVVVLMVGLAARSFVQERRDVREDREFAAMLDTGARPEQLLPNEQPRFLVGLRGITNTLKFAMDEAKMRKGRLGVLYVREVKTIIAVGAVEPDEEALKIFQAVKQEAEAQGVAVDFIYRVSHDVPDTIVQVMQEYRANFLVMGAPSGKGISSVLRGNFANHVAQNLPRGAQLLIYSWNTTAEAAAKEK